MSRCLSRAVVTHLGIPVLAMLVGGFHTASANPPVEPAAADLIEYPWRQPTPSSTTAAPRLKADHDPARTTAVGNTSVEHRLGTASRVSAPALVRVPWTESPITLAAAQQGLLWQKALPSSGIGTWGLNPVQQPQRAQAEVLVGSQMVGLGVVLEGGAVLTSLSAIGRGLDVAIRFNDGSREPATVVRTHRAYDLALLQPAGGNIRVGLPLARTIAEPLRLMVRSVRGGSARRRVGPELRPLLVEWFLGVWGADGVPMAAALKPPQLTELGSAIVNSSGHLAGLVTLACVSTGRENGPSGCQVKRVALTPATLGEFLGIAEFDPTRVWFGVVGETTDTGWARGVRVRAVSPGSPASRVGLRGSTRTVPGDVIVAIDDVPVFEVAQLRSVLAEQRAGSTPAVTVLRDGRLLQMHIPLPDVRREPPVSESSQAWVTF